MVFDQPKYFPPPQTATTEGIVAVGGELSVEILKDAYTHGIFPWPMEGIDQVLWFSPRQRGILFLDDFKVSRSLKQAMRREVHGVKSDTSFETVIRYCRSNPARTHGTWIRDDLMSAYVDFHRAGFAHCVEVYDEKGQLSGGFYGVAMNSFFCGESMFHLKSNYSKFALVHFIEHLKNMGIPWIDVQVSNPFFESMGAVEISRTQYLLMLDEALQRPAKLFPMRLN